MVEQMNCYWQMNVATILDKSNLTIEEKSEEVTQNNILQLWKTKTNKTIELHWETLLWATSVSK